MSTKIRDYKPLSEWLRNWRSVNRLSLREAGKRFGVSHNRYLHWEMGHNLPQGRMLQIVMMEVKIMIEELDLS